MDPMRGRAAVALTVLCSGIGVGLVAGCGGSSNEHDRSVASQAASQALAQERQRQQDAAQKQKLRHLQRKLRREKAQKAAGNAAGGGSGGSSGSSGSSGSGGGGGGQSKNCGSGVTANSATSCSFALNVADEYRSSGGSGSIRVYSPVTKRTYTMSCSGSSTTTCTGGNGASVTFS
jgi:hypothetical protein